MFIFFSSSLVIKYRNNSIKLFYLDKNQHLYLRTYEQKPPILFLLIIYQFFILQYNCIISIFPFLLPPSKMAITIFGVRFLSPYSRMVKTHFWCNIFLSSLKDVRFFYFLKLLDTKLIKFLHLILIKRVN